MDYLSNAKFSQCLKNMRIHISVFFLFWQSFISAKNITGNVLRYVSQASIHVVVQFRGLKLGALIPISSER